MRIAGHRWIIAFSAAVLIHAAVMAALSWEPNIRESERAGPVGVEISVGTAAAGPGSMAATSAELPEPVKPTEVAQVTLLQATEIRETAPVAVTATSPQRPREKVAASAPVPAPAVETVEPEPVKPTEGEARRPRCFRQRRYERRRRWPSPQRLRNGLAKRWLHPRRFRRRP